MPSNKQIDREHWLEACTVLTNGNRGRTVVVKVSGPEVGNHIAVEEAPLLSIAL